MTKQQIDDIANARGFSEDDELRIGEYAVIHIRRNYPDTCTLALDSGYGDSYCWATLADTADPNEINRVLDIIIPALKAIFDAVPVTS